MSIWPNGTGRRAERGPRRGGTCVALPMLAAALLVACGGDGTVAREEPAEQVELPGPRQQSNVSVEEALVSRRSVRDYTGEPLTLAEVAQLLWAAQGVTDSRGFRTSPSAGALYPLEVYVVGGEVTGLVPGVYRYLPDAHELVGVAGGDRRVELAQASVDQEWVAEAAINLVVTAVPRRTTSKYGERGIRYVHMEAGHAAQNVYLQAETLGIGVTVIGAFDDEEVGAIVGAGPDEEPLYVISVGRGA